MGFCKWPNARTKIHGSGSIVTRQITKHQNPPRHDAAKASVLVAHNFYKSSAPSGENLVVYAEQQLLKDNGHTVYDYFRHNDSLTAKGIFENIVGAISAPWNPFSDSIVKRRVKSLKPEVVHVHNTFPLITPSIFRAIGTRAAKVITLHNYRLFCSPATLLRDGKVCTECLRNGTAAASVKYGCYRNSRIATVPIAAGIELHKRLGTWKNHVDAFITLSEFQKNLMIEAGLPAQLVHVKPNFILPKTCNITWKDRTPRVSFVGRLSAEKGVEFLIRAWLSWGSNAPELQIIGDGELRKSLETLAKSKPEVRIHFLGQLPHDETIEHVSHSSLLVMPSIWFETFGLSIMEAFSLGVPVAASDIGPLSSLVIEGENGVLFKPGDANSLLNSVQSVWGQSAVLEQLGYGAKRTFDLRFTAPINYESLMYIYEQAIEVNKMRSAS